MALAPLFTERPTSCHCRNPRASAVPERRASSWFPNDHLEDGFAGLLTSAFAHMSGSCVDEKSRTTFSSSELARLLQESAGSTFCAIYTASFVIRLYASVSRNALMLSLSHSWTSDWT